MDDQKFKNLKEKYPLLYIELEYIECSDGWYDLIDELSSKLEDLILELPPQDTFQFYAIQVKQKFGELRFYMTQTTQQMDTIIHEYMKKSQKICEFCGKEGKLDGTSWLRVVCDACK